jgi:transglutaminase/protease-like cytokinesis protein 3
MPPKRHLPYKSKLPPIMKKTFCTLIIILSFVNFGFSQNESIKALVEKTSDLNLDMWDLTTFAEKNIKNKEQLAKFFYYWIGSNIKYDHKSLKEKNNGAITLEEYSKRQDVFEVYKNRKGVCAGYAKLYQWFLDWVDIETEVISGHIRDQRNHYVELESDGIYSHAWNAIKLNDKWSLVDTTWGTSNEESQSEFYFDIKPEWLIITHYPEKDEWQLLDKPLNLKEFNNSKFIKPVWFHLGFEEVPKLMIDEEYYYFVFKKPKNDWNVNLQYSLDNINFEYIKGIEPIAQDGMMYYRFKKEQINQKAFYKVGLTLLIEEENGYSTLEHKNVINFKT